jgi:phospholipid transport system transporter-binding protein
MIERQRCGLRVTAPMVIANARALLEAGRRSLAGTSSQPAGRHRAFDLAAVKEVDSSALSVVLGLAAHGRCAWLALRITNPPASLISLATLYGVSELLPLA